MRQELNKEDTLARGPTSLVFLSILKQDRTYERFGEPGVYK